MLFTTATFVVLFLPTVLGGYYLLGRRSADAAAAFLFAASLFFYGYWIPAFTLLLLASIAVNFAVAIRIQRALNKTEVHAKAWLVAGIVFNLGLLAYFKYANFFVDSLNLALGIKWNFARVVLPIGISFYSFTQIAYLVDTYSRKVGESRLIHYGLFVTYFPHLIAGPVLHHAQMMPQFAKSAVYKLNGTTLVSGLLIFAMGLFKKVVLADGVSPYADAIFLAADAGAQPAGAEAWLGTLAYTFQIYFDFSGYSDMAVGLSWMFNIKLPFNFNSPYKAASISDFWRRWHMTLSTFLRDYLYVPLGGNRKGPTRRYVNLATTMLLGGLWHGASWSFVLWGGLHGLYLGVNHVFRALVGERSSVALAARRDFTVLARCATMLAVVVAWVFFRATTLDGALRVLQSMAGLAEAQGGDLLLWNSGLHRETGAMWCAVLAVISVALPNSNRLGAIALDLLPRSLMSRHIAGGAAVVMVLMLVLINTARDSVSAFIYFNF